MTPDEERTMLIEVHGNERVMIRVEGAETEEAARREVYVAFFGDEEEPTKQTVEDHTTVVSVTTIRIGE